ncbi:MAG TPA: Uma2 family endonuclease [Planctomycetota bacterium]
MVGSRVLTAKDLIDIRGAGYRHELVRGELRRMSGASPLRGSVVARVTRHLLQTIADRDVGTVLANDAVFVLERDPDTVLAPDVAFMSPDNLPAEFAPGFYRGAPDLAIEVTSPRDSWGEVQDKALSWLAHGTRLVWIVDPIAKHVTVYRAPHDIVVLGHADTLDGGEVVPGFSVPVAALFPVR